MADKEVNFNYYCRKCVHWNKNGDEDPCNECLTYGRNDDSHKPVMYVEGKETTK